MKNPAGNGAHPSGKVVPPGNAFGGTVPTAAAAALCLISNVPEVGGDGGSGIVASLLTESLYGIAVPSASVKPGAWTI